MRATPGCEGSPCCESFGFGGGPCGAPCCCGYGISCGGDCSLPWAKTTPSAALMPKIRAIKIAPNFFIVFLRPHQRPGNVSNVTMQGRCQTKKAGKGVLSCVLSMT